MGGPKNGSVSQFHSITMDHSRTVALIVSTIESVHLFIEGILEGKLPTIWTDEKQRWEE